MRFNPTRITGALIVEPERRCDERGYFVRTWCEREFAAQGLPTDFVQGNAGYSPVAGTLRGLHFQLPPHAETKLIRCTRGAAYDVIVDLRPESPTFREWVAVEISAANGLLVVCPPGCAHGYQTLLADTELLYHTSAFYAPESARGVRYDDPALAITWPRPVACISAADRSWPDVSVGNVAAAAS